MGVGPDIENTCPLFTCLSDTYLLQLIKYKFVYIFLNLIDRDSLKFLSLDKTIRKALVFESGSYDYKHIRENYVIEGNSLGVRRMKPLPYNHC